MAETTTSGFPAMSDTVQYPRNIPYKKSDGSTGVFRTDTVIYAGEGRVEKFLIWHCVDPDERAHNHPWNFKSFILYGGYTERVYWIDRQTGQLRSEFRSYVQGDTNISKMSEYHQVVTVIPGTITHLIADDNDTEWGWLDFKTGGHIAATRDPEFARMMREVNPEL